MVEGWIEQEAPGQGAHLVGSRCTDCGSYFFPKQLAYCRNPRCGGASLDEVPLTRTGRLWSWTVGHYAPPPPYVAPDPFEPYGVAAVELEPERMIVLGQLARDSDATNLHLGDEMEIVVEDDMWKWKRLGG